MAPSGALRRNSTDVSAMSALLAIPVVDVRDGGPIRHARERAQSAQALRDDCLAWFPALAAPMVPTMDRLARRWLVRSHSPYLGDIEAIAADRKSTRLNSSHVKISYAVF